MKILITSGGTREYVDQVRVITNVSTGRLGSTIANRLSSIFNDDEVIYVHSSTAIRPYVGTCKEYVVDTVSELMTTLEKLVPEVDVVIHAMAVSDFTFEKKEDIKLKSNDPEAFIEHLRKMIKVNPKVISYIKKWNPKVFLVSFKFEVGLTNEKLIDIAYESLKNNNCDLVIANDKIEMDKAGEHIAYLIKKDKSFEKAEGRIEIADKIEKIIKNERI